MHAPQRPSTDATLSDADSQTILLRGGLCATIRPIEPADKSRLVDALAELGPESRYRGFFTSIDTLVERQLAYLTDVDHRDHEALVTIERETGGVVGVGQFVRMAPDVAEPATSWWPTAGRGADSVALLERLADGARAERIARFTGVVLAENHDAIRLVEQFGDGTREFSGSESRFEVVLPEWAGIESALREVLRAGAAGLLAPRARSRRRGGSRRRMSSGARCGCVRDGVSMSREPGGGSPACSGSRRRSPARPRSRWPRRTSSPTASGSPSTP
jgi:hypothetical protein